MNRKVRLVLLLICLICLAMISGLTIYLSIVNSRFEFTILGIIYFVFTFTALLNEILRDFGIKGKRRFVKE